MCAAHSEVSLNNASPGSEEYPRATQTQAAEGPFTLHKIGLGDLIEALRLGFNDWRACRTDVLVMVVIYPLAAILLAAAIADHALLPFLFPVCGGMALLGPMATLWFTALSRQRERDGTATSDAAAEVFASPRIIPLQRLAGGLVLLFVLWLIAAGLIYHFTLGTSDEASASRFLVRVFTTGAGAEMIVIGCAVGALFALVSLCTGMISFSLALDRNVATFQAAMVSTRAVLLNPGPSLVWGGLIVVGFVLGSIPGLIALPVTIPILGHANWHLYRRIVR